MEKQNGSQKSNPQLEDVHETMLDGLGQLSAYLGFSKVMGQLYGTLLMSTKPLSLDEMMEQLGISKASVSTTMRTLEHMGMVRQVWVRGGSGRRKYYEAETDFWQIISHLLSSRELRDVERAINIMDVKSIHLKELLPTMDDGERETAELYIERMRQLQGLFRFAQMVISTILSQVDDDADFSEITHIELE